MEIVSVAELTQYLKYTLESNPLLQDLWIGGEVSNCLRHSSGHYYFDLKESSDVLHCILFRHSALRLRTSPNNGAQIVAHGKVTIYPPKGRYQIVVDFIDAQGIGMSRLLLEQLRLKLEAEGLFDQERKRELPRFPERIAIVTSPTGAVLRDIKTVIERRYPLVELVVVPVQVQGDSAALSIVGALDYLNQIHEQIDLDTIIVARGGGSSEDLAAFNDEGVARAVFASRVPVISAVGHETDTTLIDLVADVRAPTPSAAAELAVPDVRDLRADLNDWSQRLVTAIESEIESRREDVLAMRSALRRSSPQARVQQYRQRIDDLVSGSLLHLKHQLQLERERVAARIDRLHTLDPHAVLARGYSIVRFAGQGPVVISSKQASTGDALEIQTNQGCIDVVVMYSEEVG